MTCRRKSSSEVFLELTDRQKALYQQTVAQVRSTIDDAYRTKTSGQAQFIALTAILKLRQVCLSPRLLTNQADESSPKLGFLVERLQVLRTRGTAPWSSRSSPVFWTSCRKPAFDMGCRTIGWMALRRQLRARPA